MKVACILNLFVSLFLIGRVTSSDCLNEYNQLLEQRAPSLHEAYCCTSANNEKNFSFPLSGGFTRYISCTTAPPSSCPKLKDCQSWYQAGSLTSGVYTVNPDGGAPFEVYCDMETDGGGWTVFQRREDGSVDFNRYWTDYENGFGDLTGEFWLGLTKIHRLTKEGSNILRVDLGDFDNNTRFANYSTFSVADSSTYYTLSVGGYSGTAGDSLTFHDNHNNQMFSTVDVDNDNNNLFSCALNRGGAGWWYNNCDWANLNGRYFTGGVVNIQGVTWYHWRNNDYSYKFSEMKTRK